MIRDHLLDINSEDRVETRKIANLLKRYRLFFPLFPPPPTKPKLTLVLIICVTGTYPPLVTCPFLSKRSQNLYFISLSLRRIATINLKR